MKKKCFAKVFKSADGRVCDVMVALVTEGELGDEATERERKDGGAQCVSVFHLFLVFLCFICFLCFFAVHVVFRNHTNCIGWVKYLTDHTHKGGSSEIKLFNVCPNI